MAKYGWRANAHQRISPYQGIYDLAFKAADAETQPEDFNQWPAKVQETWRAYRNLKDSSPYSLEWKVEYSAEERAYVTKTTKAFNAFFYAFVTWKKAQL